MSASEFDCLLADEICGTRQTEMASSLPGHANSGRELRELADGGGNKR